LTARLQPFPGLHRLAYAATTLSRRPLIVGLVSVLLVVAVLAVAVVVLDHRAGGRIAEGVRIGTIDVGGLSPQQARAKVRRQLLAPLDRPVVVRHEGREWRLTAGEARIHANVDGMVDEAVRRGEGNPLQRAWREVTGGRVDATVPARVSYSRGAVRGLVRRIAADVDRDPKDAGVTFSAASVGEVAGHDGRALNATALQRRILRAIDDPARTRTLRATVRTVKPDVTTDELAERYPVAITVDRKHFKLRLWKGLALAKTYGIAVGKVGLETPEGLYKIQNKAVDPAWHVPDSDWAGDLAGKVIPGDDPSNPIKARWMGIYDGAGIHGTDAPSSIGSAASHGCIRMRIPEVKQLYDQVPVGTPVYIA
jgi:lipoprotein-anchoring transpeptidase ErfK/SrfK